MSREHRTLLLAALGAVSLLAGLGIYRLTRGSNPLGVKAVVLVTIDSLGADRVGCYGGDSSATPALDRLAADGVRFERCLTTLPGSLPAHASLLSGRTSLGHGCRDDRGPGLDQAILTLPRVFLDEGFRTGAFVSNPRLDRRAGLAAGFEVYDDRPATVAEPLLAARSWRAGDETVAAALAFVDEGGALPFFLWVNLGVGAPRPPHQPVPEFTRRFPDDPGLADLAAADHALERLVLGLESRGRLADALVVVAGSHGIRADGAGDEGQGLLLKDAALRVPLLFHSPARLPRGELRRRPVSLACVAPTLVELLEFEFDAGDPEEAARRLDAEVRPAPVRGDGDEEDRRSGARAAVYYETGLGGRRFGAAPLFGVEQEGYQWLAGPASSLHRVESGRALGEELAPRELARRQVLARLLADWRAKAPPAPEAGAAEESEVGRLLAEFMASRPGPPPRQEPVPARAAVESARTVLRLEGQVLADPEGALAAIGRLVADQPRSGPLRRLEGEALALLGRLDEAAEALLGAVTLLPDDAELWCRFGQVLRRARREPTAERCLQAALELDPGNLDARVELGLLWLERGDPARARGWFDQVLRVHPGLFAARVGRAECLLAQSNVRLADEDLRVAHAVAPAEVRVLRELVKTSLLLANEDEALRFYEAARAVGAEFPRPELRLGQALDESSD